MADETPRPVAYCAPGYRDIAAAILAAKGETVSEIREHSWLEGCRDVLVCTPPEETPLEWPVTCRELPPALLLSLLLPQPPLNILTGLA